MKMILGLLITTLVTPLLREPEAVQAEYQGTMNQSIAIGLTLTHDPGDRLHGVYYYLKYFKDIPLEGGYTEDHRLILREHGHHGVLRGTFQLQPSEPGSDDWVSREQHLVGTWTDATGARSYPVDIRIVTIRDSLMVSNAKMYPTSPQMERNVQAFYFAVLRGDKQAAASHVHNPLPINFKPKRVARNKAEFLKLYDQIFTKEYVDCIRRGVPHHLWANSSGWMIDIGEVWFNEKGEVTQINPCRPD